MFTQKQKSKLLLQSCDYATASVIISEAGGMIGQVDGTKTTLSHRCSIVAGTQKAVEEIREVIRNAQGNKNTP